MPIQAFCIERGRWSKLREGTETLGLVEVSNLLAAKRIRSADLQDGDTIQLGQTMLTFRYN